MSTQDQTSIFKQAAHGEEALGFIDSDGIIYRRRWQEGKRVGRVEMVESAGDSDQIAGRIFRDGQVDERELGTFTAAGVVRSHGLFEGGDLGWLEDSAETQGVVMRGGVILPEEEVGRVEGPQRAAAAAALLLLFLPDDDEQNRQMAQRNT